MRPTTQRPGPTAGALVYCLAMEKRNGWVAQRVIQGRNWSNHRDVEPGEEYRISGVKKNGEDRNRAGRGPVTVDEEARNECERITGLRLESRQRSMTPTRQR